jgi:2-methylcitrate dehydratase PrpD
VWEGINREAVLVKHFHGGRAAAAGILAAYLARTGYPGAARVLEGERGLVAAASQSTAADIRTAMASLGTDFLVQRNFFKRYPCGLGNFHGLDAVASLANRSRIAADEVEAVTVRLASISAWMVDNPAPTSIFEAKFSLPFAIATLLTAGRLGFAEYDDRWLNDPRIRGLMGRVKLVADDSLAVDAAIVEIHTRGGQRLEGEGTWRNLTLSEVEHKFRDVVGGLLGAVRAARLVDLVYELPRAHSTEPFFDLHSAHCRKG